MKKKPKKYATPLVYLMIMSFFAQPGVATIFDSPDSNVLDGVAKKTEEKLAEIPACKIVAYDEEQNILGISSGMLVTSGNSKSQTVLTCSHMLRNIEDISEKSVYCYWGKDSNPIKVTDWECILDADVAVAYLDKKLLKVPNIGFKNLLPKAKSNLLSIGYGFAGIYETIDKCIPWDIGVKPHINQGTFTYNKKSTLLASPFLLDKNVQFEFRHGGTPFLCFVPKPNKPMCLTGVPTCGDSGSIWLEYSDNQYYAVGVTTGNTITSSLNVFYKELGSQNNNLYEREILESESKVFARSYSKKIENDIEAEVRISSLAPYVSWIEERIK